MRILFVSTGKPHQKRGGVALYVNDLIAALLNEGHTVVHLDTSCRDACGKNVRREEARRDDGLRMVRFFNLKNIADYGNGTLEPMNQVHADNDFSDQFIQWLSRIQIDLVHIHEFIGFPMKAIEHFKDKKIPVMATLHDFYPLCPTVNLMLPEGAVCTYGAGDLVCRDCCKGGNSLLESTVADWFDVLKRYRGCSMIAHAVQPVMCRTLRSFRWKITTPRHYIKRRLAAVEALSGLDLLLANSRLTAETYRTIARLNNIIEDPTFTRTTINHKAVDTRGTAATGKIRVLLLNIRRDHKGLAYVGEVLENVPPEVAEGVKFVAWGCSYIDHPLVENRSAYHATQLDEICASVDIGLIPSLWRESYGFIGAEMLSRGLPLIASNRGAMKEYIEDGRDGILFDPSSVHNLVSILSQLVEKRDMLDELQKNAGDGWKKFPTFAQHVACLVARYRGIIEQNTSCGGSGEK